MKDNGYILLHRKITESAVWTMDDAFDPRSAWIDLLLMVNHAENDVIINNKPVTVKEGERITSLRKLATRWKWSLNKVRRYLRTLERLGNVHIDGYNRYTKITVVKWAQYQHLVKQSGTKSNTKTNTQTEHRKNSDEYTDGTQTNNEQRMINNEQKKEEAAAPLILHGRVIE